MDSIKIEFTFLNVEAGTTQTVTVPTDANRVDIARIIRTYMTGSVVMTGVSMTEFGYYDDAYDIVRDMTDGDPLSDMTEERAAQLIGLAPGLGYEVPDILTPELFLEIYYDLQQKEG